MDRQSKRVEVGEVEVLDVFFHVIHFFPVNSVIPEGTSFDMLLLAHTTHITTNKVLCHAIVPICDI
jgi:hypothetical protein